MLKVFNCGFSRAFLYETRSLAIKNVQKQEGETTGSFKNRIEEERFNLFNRQFEGYPHLQLTKGKFH